MPSPTHSIVSPEEWRTRTSLRFARRQGAGIVNVDTAYEAYYALRSEDNARTLHRALDAYLIEHGRHWENIDRNKNSNGLMQWVFDFTKWTVQGGRPSPLLTVEARDRATLHARIPETREGVLYLWQNTNVSTQYAQVITEGVFSMGATAMSTTSTLSNSTGREAIGLASGSGSAIAVAKIAGATRSTAALESGLSTWESIKRTLGGAWASVKKAVEDFVANFMDKMTLLYHNNRECLIGITSKLLEKLVLYVLSEVAKAMVPFVGAAIDIGRGVAQTLKGIKHRLEAYLNRSQFIVMPGHPTMVANSIERQMNWAIGKGLWSAIKGGAKMGLQVVTAGASAIVDAVAVGIEFIVKFILREIEGSGMKAWIAEVKEVCKETAAVEGADPTRRQRPVICNNTNKFNDLVEKGCDASACIPIMTLNSGISGDQMMFMKMFDDSSRPQLVTAESFGAATAYFTQLKQFGAKYITQSGFQFTSAKRDVTGLLTHATTGHKASSELSTADAVLAFAS